MFNKNFYSPAYNSYPYNFNSNYYQRPQLSQPQPPPPPPPPSAPNGHQVQNAWATYPNSGPAPHEHSNFSQPPPSSTNHGPSMPGPGSYMSQTQPRHAYSQPHPAFSSGVPMSQPNQPNGPNNGVIRFKLQQKPQPKPNLDSQAPVSAFSSTSPTKRSQGTEQKQYASPASSSTANRSNISSNSNGSTSVQGVGQSADKPGSTNGQWPPELHEYVTRAFAVSSDELDKDRIEIILKGKITKALNEGTMHTKDWKNEPLPVLTKSLSAKDTSSFPSNFKQSTSPQKSFKSFEHSKSVDKSKSNHSSPGKGSSHSYSSGSYSDSSDSDSKMKTYGKRFYHEDIPSKKKMKKKR